MKPFPLHWQIAFALVLAVLAGFFTGRTTGALQSFSLQVYAFLGTLFLNGLKMLIVPLVVSAMISGISNIGSGTSLGRMGSKTILFYAMTTLLAILTGLFLVNLFSPGTLNGQPVKDKIGLSEDRGIIQEQIADRQKTGLSDFFYRMVPANIIYAAAQGQMLGLIFFSVLFGFFMTKIKGPGSEILSGFWQAIFDVMILLTEWIMRFAPLGVFGLVAKVAATAGASAIQPLAWFFATVLAGLSIHFFIILPLLLKFFGKVSPTEHFRAMAPALLTAFSTSSSSATVPVTMNCLEKNAKISNRTASFVVPLGATVNMDGTALYECVVVLFVAQAYGVSLDWASQLTVVVLALMTSVGVAGIPAASLVAIVLILEAVGLPAEAVGLVIAVDRILDMCRTTVNVFSDSCGAAIIGRWEGEKPYGK